MKPTRTGFYTNWDSFTFVDSSCKESSVGLFWATSCNLRREYPPDMLIISWGNPLFSISMYLLPSVLKNDYLWCVKKTRITDCLPPVIKHCTWFHLFIEDGPPKKIVLWGKLSTHVWFPRLPSVIFLTHHVPSSCPAEIYIFVFQQKLATTVYNMNYIIIYTNSCFIILRSDDILWY